MIPVSGIHDFKSWRLKARELLQAGVRPEQVQWQNAGEMSLFQNSFLDDAPLDFQGPLNVAMKAEFRVPKEFMEKAPLVAQARDDARWDLLYRILYRLQHEEFNLLKVSVDSDIRRFDVLYKQITRDIHKMHAFVRFKKVMIEGEEFYLAWHSPEHQVTELAAPFFVRRFGDKPWAIFTPDISVHWDGKKLHQTPGILQHQFEHQDDFDTLWKTYYKSIFNPARVKIKAMKAEMPTRFWNSLPEADLIPELIREAPHRLQKMALNQNHSAVVPAHSGLADLGEKARACTACPLYRTATQTVFGEGNPHAEVMIVGEQPGDNEDLEGHPFVGPAGEILNECLKLAALTREDLYLTNAVKHFKWEARGKLRLHKKASGQEMHACRPWLEAEIALVKPKIIIALGVTAGTAVLGRLPKISSERGHWITGHSFADAILLSWHPSAILRSSSPEEKEQRMNELAQDLKMAAEALQKIHSMTVQQHEG